VISKNKLSNWRIILASQSPRRQQLLHELGVKFDLISKDFDESYPASLKREEIALFLAKSKANQLMNELTDNDIIITADTIVWCNDKVLGKPVDRADAYSMLREISGNTHEVITGVTLLSKKIEKTFSVSTKVTFETLTDEDIYYYIDSFKPFDKAGAYGIQEWIGLAACSHIEGSYFNVVGLPVQRLYKELELFIKNYNN
jgi:septum formation protein